jgi:hypothetical protein
MKLLDVLFRLALPIALVIASLILYEGMTGPYHDCIKGKLAIGSRPGTEVSDFTRGLAATECMRH